MNKSTVIAHCLVRTKLVSNISFAQVMVIDHFNQNFSAFDYHEWNSEVTPSAARLLIKTFDSTKPINLDSLIMHLWEH
jgi:hypothetical protein